MHTYNQLQSGLGRANVFYNNYQIQVSLSRLPLVLQNPWESLPPIRHENHAPASTEVKALLSNVDKGREASAVVHVYLLGSNLKFDCYSALPIRINHEYFIGGWDVQNICRRASEW